MEDLEFDKKIKKIMIQRKPEHWLDDIFMNLTEYTHDKYPDLIFYKKGNNLVFYYNPKNECFYYNYLKIYFILRKEYHCDDNKISELIKNVAENLLKLLVKRTMWIYNYELCKDENILKLRVNG